MSRKMILSAWNAVFEKSKQVTAWFSLFYLTLYIPFASMVYFSGWYSYSSNLHSRCDYIDPLKKEIYINELTDYFFHQDNLKTDWTRKEKFHLSEVRSIFDFLALLFTIFLVIFVITINARKIKRFCLINIILILSLFLIIPFFSQFWMKIFHPILFDNTFWKNNPFDVSFYIMPPSFFKYSAILLFCASILINSFIFLIFWKLTKRKKKNDRLKKSIRAGIF